VSNPAAPSTSSDPGFIPPPAPALDSKTYSVALAGNPNCGKTTLFNALTGLRYKVANYPGVTVERKRGRLCLPQLEHCALVDLPGIYSLVGSSIDERIATSVLLGDFEAEPVPDCIVVVLDASNLERNLYLATQLIDCGVPIVLALNMVDLAKKQGLTVHTELLSRQLDVPIVAIVAKTGTGLDLLRGEISRALRQPAISTKRFGWLPADSPFRKAAQKLGEHQLSAHGKSNQRIPLIIGCSLLADSVLPDSKPLHDELVAAKSELTQEGIDPASFEATARYRWINEIVRSCCSKVDTGGSKLGERLDALLTHRVWGSLIFFAIMAFIFQSIFLWAQVPMDLIEEAFTGFGNWVGSHMSEGALQSLLVEGIIAGVGNVVIFVPQIAVLFFFLGLLEDSGYLSRAAFLMDKVMRPVGLQGRSFIPLLSSFACAIPGILSSRTIPSWSDRMATIMVAPLMSCSARIPVYTVLIAAFIPNQLVWGFISLQGVVLLAMYLLGVFGAAIAAWLLKLSVLRGKPALFVMEMPPVRRPSLRVVLREVLDRVITFLKAAGTMILACSIVLWFLASYPKPPEHYEGSKVAYSFAGKIGKAMEPIIKPLGYNWEIGVGILASFAAREVFVSALSTVYNLESEETNSDSLIEILKSKKAAGTFSTAAALSLMVFYVFACQCMSTLAVCKRETGSWGWTGFMFVYMTIMAYVAAFATYHILSPLLAA